MLINLKFTQHALRCWLEIAAILPSRRAKICAAKTVLGAPKATRHFDTSYKLINCWQDRGEQQSCRPAAFCYLYVCVCVCVHALYIQCHLCKYSNKLRPPKLIANTRKRRKDEEAFGAAGETTTCLGLEPKAQQHDQESRTFALTDGGKRIAPSYGTFEK